MSSYRIVGVGSLLSKESALNTCPSARDFKLAKLKGYIRIFNKVYSPCVREGKLKEGCNKIAALSLVPAVEKQDPMVSVFTIEKEDWHDFLMRESDYKLVELPYFDIESDEELGRGVACLGDFSSEREYEEMCASDPVRHRQWRAFKDNTADKMWRSDILPEEEYLQECIEASQEIHQNVHQNFLDTTFLADGQTSIRDYIQQK